MKPGECEVSRLTAVKCIHSFFGEENAWSAVYGLGNFTAGQSQLITRKRNAKYGEEGPCRGNFPNRDFFLDRRSSEKKSFKFENILSPSNYLQGKAEFQFLKQSISPLFFESGVGS